MLHPQFNKFVNCSCRLLFADTKRVLKSASLDFSFNDFPGSQIRLSLHNAHTDNSSVRENSSIAAHCFNATKKFLTGPHTFIAISFSSKHQPCDQRFKLNAIKASVPKLLNCPGSGFASPFRDDRPAVSRPPLKLTTSWDRSLNLVSTLRTLQSFRSSHPSAALRS